jgi:hypothetical protein
VRIRARPFVRGGRSYIVGRAGDSYGFDALDLVAVEQPAHADFILILGSDAPATSRDRYARDRASAHRRFQRHWSHRDRGALPLGPLRAGLDSSGAELVPRPPSWRRPDAA